MVSPKGRRYISFRMLALRRAHVGSWRVFEHETQAKSEAFW